MGHVLKASQVRLEEPLRLSIDGTGTPGHGAPLRPAAQPRVRLVESNAQFAVLEVTCACGRATHVRCEYAAADTAPAPQGPAQP
jgi:hypothetical protein